MSSRLAEIVAPAPSSSVNDNGAVRAPSPDLSGKRGGGRQKTSRRGSTIALHRQPIAVVIALTGRARRSVRRRPTGRQHRVNASEEGPSTRRRFDRRRSTNPGSLDAAAVASSLGARIINAGAALPTAPEEEARIR